MQSSWISYVKVIVTGVIAVYFLKRVIALINEGGQIVWRDPDYPADLVEYLIETQPTEAYKWN